MNPSSILPIAAYTGALALFVYSLAQPEIIFQSYESTSVVIGHTFYKSCIESNGSRICTKLDKHCVPEDVTGFNPDLYSYDGGVFPTELVCNLRIATPLLFTGGLGLNIGAGALMIVTLFGLLERTTSLMSTVCGVAAFLCVLSCFTLYAVLPGITELKPELFPFNYTLGSAFWTMGGGVVCTLVGACFSGGVYNEICNNNKKNKNHGSIV
eukprot:GHVR01143675.1.p1 GENE.GHVR01143675.1~~GHVR01143675.1.p1  ORF type:complete len:225 (+),score=38.20 GHVR01143675.1:44-676(+)